MPAAGGVGQHDTKDDANGGEPHALAHHPSRECPPNCAPSARRTPISLRFAATTENDSSPWMPMPGEHQRNQVQRRRGTRSWADREAVVALDQILQGVDFGDRHRRGRCSE